MVIANNLTSAINPNSLKNTGCQTSSRLLQNVCIGQSLQYSQYTLCHEKNFHVFSSAR